MRTAYLDALYELTGNDSRVLCLVGDIGAIVFDKYREDFPDRFLNLGVAEANMISAAAGMALCGKIPFAYTIATFITMRAYEQIRDDVCLMNTNVKIVGVGCGVVYSLLGSTHHATEDLAIMRALPNLTILSPASPMEVRWATALMASREGPVYLRLGTNGEPEVHKQEMRFELGKGIEMAGGSDITIISTGSIISQAFKAREALAQKGVTARVINMHTLKPLDEEIILKAADQTEGIVTLEEHSIIGGLGAAVCEVVSSRIGGNRVPVRRVGLRDRFSTGYGNHQDVLRLNGLSHEDIVREALLILEHEQSANNCASVARG